MPPGAGSGAEVKMMANNDGMNMLEMLQQGKRELNAALKHAKNLGTKQNYAARLRWINARLRRLR